jgi:hypothetical protein
MPRPTKTKKAKIKKAVTSSSLSARLLAWYDIHRRVLPWRAQSGKRADPYRVWLSEIMLQPDHGAGGGNYYRKFLALWPDVQALANAKQDDVLAAWAGLGYYARARNLHAAAKVVASEMGGKFPATAESLRVLPEWAVTPPPPSRPSLMTETGGDGRQCRAGDCAPLRRADTDAQGQARIACAMLGAGAGAGRGFRASPDGSGLRHLHAQAPGLRQLSVDG